MEPTGPQLGYTKSFTLEKGTKLYSFLEQSNS